DDVAVEAGCRPVLCPWRRGPLNFLAVCQENFLCFPGKKLETASLTVDSRTRDLAADGEQTQASGSGPPLDPSLLTRSRRSTLDSSCGLRSILLQVRDLGLGYDSDEIVLFKYCGGTCPRITSNHDLTLANLLHSGVLPQLASGDLWHHTPCCRPTHHEDMAFLDNSHRWHKVEKLSAAGCSCVG
uniref:Artemin n=1 Tax=Takifugu rubripes TaxID=31033 RepID=H2SYQ8_TAKRU